MTSQQTNAIQQRIEQLIEDGRTSRAGMARAAGLHANTLRDCLEPEWNPTADTLAKLEAFLDANDDRPVLASVDEIIDEARNGRMFILVDDEDRENEGDLVIPAQMATPAAVNFMATHGRGLICLAMTRERADELGLEPMARNNRTRHATAFTTSIEAREGVTTGISAGDRARTISVAIDTSRGEEDIVSPGHVFPLVARPGGVLSRTGHTEAAVDISRLAGLNPSGVICEIMKDDGTMARMDDLIDFARRHEMKIGTIRDLVAYRHKHDRLIENTAEASFERKGKASWKAITFQNNSTGDENIALVHGRVIPDKPTLVRMHTVNLFDDLLDAQSPRQRLLERAMDIIECEGAGVAVLINRATPNRWTRAVRDQAGQPMPDGSEELRDYGGGAQILAELGVQDMELLTDTQHSLVALEGYGISIIGQRPLH